MMKKILLTLAVVFTALASNAEVKARQAFANAPTGVFMLLDRNDRLDMIDYFDSNLSSPVNNALNGKSRITAMTDDIMTIEMTPSSTYTLALLRGEAEADDVIALIITVSTPAKDSRISFYSASDWTPLDSRKIFSEPELKTWLTPDGQKNTALVEGIVPFIMAEYNYDPATSKLTLTSDLATFLSTDMYDMIKEYLRPSLDYSWTGKKLVLDR